MKALFQVALRKTDGSVVQRNVVAESVGDAVSKVLATAEGAEFLSAVSLGKVDIE